MWVSERRDLLSGLFYLLAVLAYLRTEPRGRTRWLLVSLGSFLLSLLSKAWGITLPLVLIVLDAYPLRRRALREKIPYAVLALAGAVMAFRAVSPIQATRTLAEHGLLARAAQAAYGLCFYLGKTLLPLGLSPLYRLELRLVPTQPRYVLSVLTVAGITLVLVALRRRWPAGLAAWACYVITVSPVLGMVQTGPQIAADRYTYLACLPWAVLLAGGVLAVIRARVVERAARGARSAALAGTVAALGLLAALMTRQTGVWRDSRTLWEHVLRLDSASYIAYTNRGATRDLEGDWQGALADYDAAIRVHPGYALAYYNRGSARHEHGDLEGALADLTAAVQLNPRDPQAWNNRGWAREAKGDVAGALADYAEARRVAPADFPGRAKIEENLARTRAVLGG